LERRRPEIFYTVLVKGELKRTGFSAGECKGKTAVTKTRATNTVMQNKTFSGGKAERE